MREIKVGVNADFPDAEQKSHTIVMERFRNPPPEIKYDWAYPIKLNNKGVHFHPKNNKFDLLEVSNSLLLTTNSWISRMVTIEFAMFMKFNGKYFDRAKRSDILRKIYRKDNVKKIVFYCHSGLSSLKNYAGIEDRGILDKSCVVYNSIPNAGVPLSNKKNDGKFRILFIGTAFYLKGGASLVEAFEILQKKYPFIELEIHSSVMKDNYLDSELYQPLDHEETIEKIKRNKSIFNYHSFEMDRDQIIKEVYPRADLFILPSMQEGLPYVVQEAVAYGLPVISTNCVPSIPEIIEDGVNGLLIDVKNKTFKKVQTTFNDKGQKIITKESHNLLTREIVLKISRLIEDDNLRKQIVINNLKKAKEILSFEKNNKILRSIYEEATS